MFTDGCQFGRLPGPLGLCVEEELQGGTRVSAFDEPSAVVPATPPVVVFEPEPTSSWNDELQMRDFSDQKLIEDSPLVTDVRQGETGNCPLIATLAALAYADPGRISRMVRRSDADVRSNVIDTSQTLPSVYLKPPPKSKHLYEVVFADGEPIQVSGLLWHRNDAIKFGTSARGDLWPSILEKAFVFGHGANSYGAIFGSLIPFDVMTTVLGPTSDIVLAKPQGLEKMLKRAKQKPTIADTLTVLPAEVAVPPGIIGFHTYAVLGIDKSGRVKVYNPLDGATIEVPIKTFRRVFYSVAQVN
jgi:hypothetical protein